MEEDKYQGGPECVCARKNAEEIQNLVAERAGLLIGGHVSR